MLLSIWSIPLPRFFRQILKNFVLNNGDLQYLANPLGAECRKLTIKGINRAAERIVFTAAEAEILHKCTNRQ